MPSRLRRPSHPVASIMRGAKLGFQQLSALRKEEVQQWRVEQNRVATEFGTEAAHDSIESTAHVFKNALDTTSGRLAIQALIAHYAKIGRVPSHFDSQDTLSYDARAIAKDSVLHRSLAQIHVASGKPGLAKLLHPNGWQRYQVRARDALIDAIRKCLPG